MITVYHGYHFGRQAKIAIEPHVHDPYRNVLPRKAMLYAAGSRKPNYPVPAIRLEVDLIMVWINLSLDKAKREAKCFRAFRKHFMRKFMRNYRTSGPRYN